MLTLSCIETPQYKYHDAHEKAKGHYLASTLVDYPEVVRSGHMEKMKNLVSCFHYYHA